MQIRHQITIRCACLVTIALASLGCHQAEKQAVVAEMPTMTVAPVPPDVVVVGHEASREHLAALQELTTEIRNSLSLLGGLHLLDSPTVVLDHPCNGSAQATTPPALIGQIQPVGFSEFESAPLNFTDPYPPFSDDGYVTDKYEVRIVINEFLQYRPMRLAGTITIHDTSTGGVIHTIQNTWYAPKDCSPIADASCFLQQSLRRPEPAGHLERDAMAVLSPQRFLYQIAKKVAPEIKAACLPYHCSVNPGGVH